MSDMSRKMKFLTFTFYSASAMERKCVLYPDLVLYIRNSYSIPTCTVHGIPVQNRLWSLYICLDALWTCGRPTGEAFGCPVFARAALRI